MEFILGNSDPNTTRWRKKHSNRLLLYLLLSLSFIVCEMVLSKSENSDYLMQFNCEVLYFFGLVTPMFISCYYARRLERPLRAYFIAPVFALFLSILISMPTVIVMANKDGPIFT